MSQGRSPGPLRPVKENRRQRMARVSRLLFPVSRSDIESFRSRVSTWKKNQRAEFQSKYNFDPESEVALPGRLDWQVSVPDPKVMYDLAAFIQLSVLQTCAVLSTLAQDVMSATHHMEMQQRASVMALCPAAAATIATAPRYQQSQEERLIVGRPRSVTVGGPSPASVNAQDCKLLAHLGDRPRASRGHRRSRTIASVSADEINTLINSTKRVMVL